MSAIDPLSHADLQHLEAYLPASTNKDPGLPFVTLTYASSLDSMISLSPGTRTTLSGPETKSMTHYLRLKHDAILVGVGTAIPDDPGLNCRYPGVTLESQPQPVIVDPRRRWSYRGSKLEHLADQRQGKAPWLLHADCSPDHGLPSVPHDGAHHWDMTADAGIATENHKLDWALLLRALKRKGIESVMIEGGATIISALLALPKVVDAVIITIAPTWLGQGGVLVSPAQKTVHGERVNAARLRDATWRQFGHDVVLCGRLD